MRFVPVALTAFLVLAGPAPPGEAGVLIVTKAGPPDIPEGGRSWTG